MLGFAACGWDPTHPFDRDAPPVKSAIKELGDGGDAGSATDLLEAYLNTGGCSPEGNIGTPPQVRAKSNGAFDLGLALFRMGEQYGNRFGDEEVDAGGTPELRAQRVAQVDCARRVAQAVAEDESQPIDLRARARYLEGNLHFLLGEYEEAVTAYDKALTLAPGFADGGDEVGRDAAWNRALALKRIQDKKDAGNDASNDANNDGSNGEAGSDGGNEGGNEGGSGDSGGKDSGNDSGDGGGGGQDSGGDATADSGNQGDAGKPPPQDGGAQPPPKQSQDDRMLDRLENAPTFQHEAARKAAQQHHVSGSLDK
jgi:tetratricopeptide (TPR) repeat protein